MVLNVFGDPANAQWTAYEHTLDSAQADLIRRDAEPVDRGTGPAPLGEQDVEDLYRYIAERLAGIETIQSYDMSIRTQRLKQAGSIIAHGRLVQPGA